MRETLMVRRRRSASRWMRSGRARVALLSVLWLCLAHGARVFGEDSLSQDAQRELIERIVSQWTERHDAIHALRVEVEGTMLTPKGTFTGADQLPAGVVEAPAEDHRSPLAMRWWIDFRRNRVRIDTDTETFYVPEAKFRPTKQIAIFDGRNVIQHNLAVTLGLADYVSIQPNFYVYQGASFEMFRTLAQPILYFRGVAPKASSYVVLSNMNSTPKKDSFRYVGELAWKGANCVILRTLPKASGTPLFSEFWVDVEHESVVRRWFLKEGAAVHRVVDIDYRQQNDRWVPSAWKVAHYEGHRPSLGRRREVPSAWKVAHYGGAGRHLWKSHAVTVSKFEINPALNESENLFVLQPFPGMVVQDQVGGRDYRLAEDGITKLRPGGLPFAEPLDLRRFHHFGRSPTTP